MILSIFFSLFFKFEWEFLDFKKKKKISDDTKHSKICTILWQTFLKILKLVDWLIDSMHFQRMSENRNVWEFIKATEVL